MPTTDVKSEGIYRCEVSSEAPIFGTVKGERELRIYGKSHDNDHWPFGNLPMKRFFSPPKIFHSNLGLFDL